MLGLGLRLWTSCTQFIETAYDAWNSINENWEDRESDWEDS